MDNIQVQILSLTQKISSFLACMKEIYDPRLHRRIRHTIPNTIVIVLFAQLGGANNPTQIERYCNMRIDFFRLVLAIPYGIPSHDIISTILSIIGPKELSDWTNLWRECEIGPPESMHICVDGKKDKANKYHALRAFEVNSGQIINHTYIPDGSNEITVMESVLKSLPLKNSVITADAMHAQKKHARIIANGKGHYLFALKGNQYQFYQDVTLYLDSLFNGAFQGAHYDRKTYQEYSRGQLVVRECVSTEKLDWLFQKKQWKNIRSISLIKTIRYKKSQMEISYRYYISSLPADSQLIMQYARGHWAIENQCHRDLDMNFDSDRSTIRYPNAARNHSVIKDLALSIIKSFGSNLPIKHLRDQYAYGMRV
jgi:predicted transposase YbfD/YdcC